MQLLPIAISALSLAAPRQGPPQFDVVELPRTEGFQTHVFAMNESGSSVGYMLDDELRWRALLWDVQARVTELGDPGAWSIARGISEAGIAVGIDGPTVQQTSPHAWFQGAEVALPVPPGVLGADLYDVNDQPIAVGNSTDVLGSLATAWLGVQSFFLANAGSAVFEVNDQPAAVGQVRVGGFPEPAHWGVRGLTLLDDLGGDGSAAGLSPGGAIAGGVLSPVDDKLHAVLWPTFDAPGIDLGLFGDLNPTTANDVNDAGTVVGHYTVVPVNGESRAVLWTAGGVAVDLNDAIPPGSGWILHDARAIDGAGRVVGVGERTDLPGGQRAFLLTPVGASDPSPGASGDRHRRGQTLRSSASRGAQ